jgi:DNA invertase Pin-like site-specific DNA recombinase
MSTAAVVRNLKAQVSPVGTVVPTGQPDIVRAAVYCRISSDPTGRALGVDRQRADCTTLALARGWDVAMVLTDNDISAFSGKTRPRYELLLNAIRSGAVNAVVAWHADRLHRSPRELEQFIELVEAHGVTVETVRSGHHDFTTAHGRLMARLTGAVARSESEQKSERITRALQQRRAQGKPHGATSYGWRREYDTAGRAREVVHEAQAAVVRELADRIVRGDSLRAICRDLDDRGVPAPAGTTWRPSTVSRTVRRERNVALVVHTENNVRQVVGDGDWPAILPRGLFDQVCAILTDPARKTTTATASKHLLSGLGTCGVCGATLRSATATSGSGRKFPVYRCSAKGCVSREQTHIDDYVTRLVVGALAAPDAADLLVQERGPEAAQAADEAASLRARLDTAADEYADGKIDARQLERITAKLRPRIAAADAASRIIDDRPILDGIVGADDVAAVWATLPLSRQRAIVDMYVTVRLDKKSRRGRGLDLDGVVITWRT